MFPCVGSCCFFAASSLPNGDGWGLPLALALAFGCAGVFVFRSVSAASSVYARLARMIVGALVRFSPGPLRLLQQSFPPLRWTWAYRALRRAETMITDTLIRACS